MKITVEKTFDNLDRTCLGWTYRNFEVVLRDLIYEMRGKIGEEYHNLKFFMNPRFFNEFSIACQTSGHVPDMYGGIRIILDPTLPQFPEGIVRLVYEEFGAKRYSRYYDFWTDQSKIENALGFSNKFICLDRGHRFQRVPHIDHVKFNGPATIVFWKDGTKTVVKHDGNGRKDKRQAILYAFIRKIYGEGRPYHNILNEIEEAVK